jgi:predicted RNA-binding protein
MARNYWIVVASRDHAAHGVENSIIQANHGKRAALDRMKPGDEIAIYSPKEAFGKPGRLQAFTALGKVADGDVWQADMGGGFKPFRRKVEYAPVKDAPLQPLLERLKFIRNKKSYGAVFRFGIIKVPEDDFLVIKTALKG